MTTDQIEVLSLLVSRYDERGDPVRAAEIATEVDTDPATVRNTFENFESKHLLKAIGDGYRPTTTARELLELDISEEALIILDPQPD